MCLTLEKPSRQKRFLARFKKGLICYKILRTLFYFRKNRKGLYSVFFNQEYLPGLNEAREQIAKNNNEIYGGVIHVFTSLKKAKEFQKFGLPGDVIIPVVCKKKDFRGYGYGEACFKKVYLSQQDYNKAINEI
mgnify:FL=1